MRSNKHQTVVFISNPFGFGPAGKSVALMGELAARWRGKIIYAASSRCLELLPKTLAKKIEITQINERNETELKKIFTSYSDPLVVVCLNRVAIRTAKKMGLYAVFVDSLSWMWKQIPEDYLLADTYYAICAFPPKSPLKNHKNIRIISPALGKLPPARRQRDNFTLVHIGGLSNPFHQDLPKNYLRLLSLLLTNAGNKKCIVTGGSRAIDYLAKSNNNHNLRFETAGRDVFLGYLSRSGHFITTPGQTAILEAFTLKTPVSLLLPTNLSQWEQSKRFKNMDLAPSAMQWEDYLRYEWNFNLIPEKEAITLFEILAGKLLADSAKLDRFMTDARRMLYVIPPTDRQSEYISRIGTNGTEMIVEDLLKLLA